MMALAETRFGLTVLTALPIDAERSRSMSAFDGVEYGNSGKVLVGSQRAAPG